MPVEYERHGYKWMGVVHIDHWRPRPPVAVWFSGVTKPGGWRKPIHVLMMGDPYSDNRSWIEVNGVAAEKLGVQRYRDGGTTIIKTNLGRIYYPAPFRNQNPTIDSEELHAL